MRLLVKYMQKRRKLNTCMQISHKISSQVFSGDEVKSIIIEPMLNKKVLYKKIKPHAFQQFVPLFINHTNQFISAMFKNYFFDTNSLTNSVTFLNVHRKSRDEIPKYIRDETSTVPNRPVVDQI